MNEQPVAIVTGGSRGIGRAIVRELAVAGHQVVINYATRRDAAEDLASEISAAGGTAISVGADVGKTSDRQTLIERTLAEFGRLDVLVNNAGITSPARKDLLDATEEGWDQVFNTNLKGPFFLSQLAANRMICQMQDGQTAGGKIINISSISAYAVSYQRADYCMTKAALSTMTQLFADRLAEYNIGVFEICPGVIATDMTGPVKEKYDGLIAEGLTPIRRWGQPEDVARAVAAIVRGYFPFSTGERINVDGGFHIRRL
jgi:NAD(P)-dependent dehydrogenase (short-subunit alcohol dehydrogenase family)